VRERPDPLLHVCRPTHISTAFVHGRPLPCTFCGSGQPSPALYVQHGGAGVSANGAASALGKTAFRCCKHLVASRYATLFVAPDVWLADWA
jgi:hypothetical protein